MLSAARKLKAMLLIHQCFSAQQDLPNAVLFHFNSKLDREIIFSRIKETK
jgi:hypothetical protein